ncbi:MAG: DUF7312 domain-containing protein [Halococcoides sp.]
MPAADTDAEADEWEFAVEDVGEDAEEDDLAGVFGYGGPDSETIERESVDLENALFVLAGVALTLFAIWQVVA